MTARKFRTRAAPLALALCVSLAGCGSMSNQQTAGTAIGAIAGALLGSKLGNGGNGKLAIVGGAALGAALGNVIGKQMDESDRRKMTQALAGNAAGESTKWKNESTGAAYAVTPTNTFVRDGRQCRTFEQEAIVNGQPSKMIGTACKRADGESWEVAT